MYIPHYINAALPKTMSRTQQVRHTVKSFRIFSLLTTIAAVMCDWTQLNYYTQLSLNDTFWGGVSVSIIVVLGLDVSMFFLGTVLNQYRKATGTTKGNFRFIGIGLLVTFLIAYVVYLLMAIPVLSQQASVGMFLSMVGFLSLLRAAPLHSLRPWGGILRVNKFSAFSMKNLKSVRILQA